MTKLCCLAILVAGVLAGCNVSDDDEKTSQEMNVNSRYTVEKVLITGERTVNISDPLRSQMNSFVGTTYDHSALVKVADRIKKELHVPDVQVKVARGTAPDRLVVNFEVTPASEHTFDLNVGQFVYASKEGWSGDGGATVNVRGNSFSFDLVSNADALVERYAGVRATYQRKSVGTDRLRFRFDFSSYHDEWNAATLQAAPASEIYTDRYSFSPMATVVIADPLELDFGADFARFRVPSPVPVEGEEAAAARTESSNAVVSTLRYHQRWGSDSDVQQQEANAAYSVEAATGVLGADREFTRHTAKARYNYRHGHHSAGASFLAGTVNGDAPLWERFVLGDSTTLRGWNKFDVDPLGGSHVVYGSVDYSYRIFQIFYDTGAIWDTPQQREARQSVGVGFKKEGFQLAVAFPVGAGRIDPIFYAGMNF